MLPKDLAGGLKTRLWRPRDSRGRVGDRDVDLVHRPQPAFRDEPRQEFRVVYDLVVAAELRVLVRQGVEAVRAGGDDLPGADLFERLHVLLRQFLEQQFLPSRRPRLRCRFSPLRGS